MFTKATITAIALTATFAINSPAQAKEVNLEQFVGHMMNNTIHATKIQLQYNIQEAVLTASNMFSLDSGSQVASSVTITDLTEQKATNKQAE
ncbi:MAG: hypothetical protein ACJA13_000169 [Paraglaciecola sp.]|jgi:hypothetical protein